MENGAYLIYKGPMIRGFLLFFVGAVLGTFGDWTHVISNTLGYPNAVLRIPGTEQPFWVPLLFGFAAFSIGLSHPMTDLQLKRKQKNLAFSSVLMGVFVFLASYALSGFLPFETGGLRDLILALIALLVWWFYDGSWQGILLGLMTAGSGALVEMGLSRLGAFSYNPEVANFYGIPSWVPWIYITASVTVGNVGRFLKERYPS